MSELITLAEIAGALRTATTIAVLGAHEQPARPSFYVPDYLAAQGYRILPVNPVLEGQVLWGQVTRATLTDIAEPVDIVDVFRRSDQLPNHLDELLAMAPRPRLVWLQLGIHDDAFARAVLAAGIHLVQDRCMLADHRALAIGRRS